MGRMSQTKLQSHPLLLELMYVHAVSLGSRIVLMVAQADPGFLKVG